MAGTWDDCVHMWPAAVDMAMEAGDDETVAALVELIDGQSNGPVSPGYVHSSKARGRPPGDDA